EKASVSLENTSSYKNISLTAISDSLEDIVPDAPSRHILLAEDDDVARKLLVSMLTRWGFNVSAVANGQEALDSIDDKEWDVLLMDMQMPIMNGETLVNELRQRSDAKGKIPILALTGMSAGDMHAKWLEDGVNFV